MEYQGKKLSSIDKSILIADKNRYRNRAYFLIMARDKFAFRYWFLICISQSLLRHMLRLDLCCIKNSFQLFPFRHNNYLDR